MNSKTLRSAITSVDDANCLCFCAGYLHFMAFVAFDRMMLDNDVTLRGVILASGTTQNKQWNITAEMISELFEDRFILVQEDGKRANTLKLAYESCIGGLIPSILAYSRLRTKLTSRCVSNADPFYFCYASWGNPPFFAIDAAFRQGRRLITVELEEGIGTYIGNVHEWRNIGSGRTHNPIKKTAFKIYELLVYPWDSLFERILKNECEHELSTFFVAREGLLVTNQQMMPYMQNAMKATMDLRESSEKPNYSNSAVIVTGKFDAFHWDKAEIAVLERIIASLKERGLIPILKPHPGSRNTSRYESFEIPIARASGISFEESLSQPENKPTLIVGFASSALVFANALYKIPSISIEQLLETEVIASDTNVSALNAFMKDTKEAYETFGRCYERPATYEEFNAILDQVVRK